MAEEQWRLTDTWLLAGIGGKSIPPSPCVCAGKVRETTVRRASCAWARPCMRKGREWGGMAVGNYSPIKNYPREIFPTIFKSQIAKLFW